MNNSKTTVFYFLAAGIMVAMCCLGCGTSRPKPQPWNISINKTTYASIQVDLIGVTEAEKPYWEGYNIDEYWRDGNLRRKDSKPLTQILQMGKPWTIAQNDPKWQEWLKRGATELLVIANLPGHFDPGAADPRRIFLPLDKHAWDAKKHTLQVEVQDTMILVQTPQKPQ